MIRATIGVIAVIALLLACVYAVASHALPVLVALACAQALIALGWSVTTTIAGAVIAGALTLAFGRYVLSIPHPSLRLIAIVAFVLPAIYAGFAVSRSILAIAGFGAATLPIAAGLGGLFTGAIALSRMTGLGALQSSPSSTAANARSTAARPGLSL